MRRNEENSLKLVLGFALRQHNSPSRVFMLLKSILVIESVLISPVRTSLPHLFKFKFFFLILESHSTIEGVISPSTGERSLRERVIAIVALRQHMYF